MTIGGEEGSATQQSRDIRQGIARGSNLPAKVFSVRGLNMGRGCIRRWQTICVSYQWGKGSEEEPEQ